MNNSYEESLIVYLIIVIYITVRRLRPRKFRSKRMYFWPIIYILLIISFSAQVNDPLVLLSLIPSGVLGYFLGYRLLENNEIKFFFKDGTLYYKWPYSVTLTWSLLYILRMSLEFFALNSLTIVIIDLLLALNTGILIAASAVTLREAKKFTISG
ncbi:MAG: hypothetical protein L7G92_04075 [Stygiolobus sp.]|nr:hypothetical protein [Stygiolobus sp.]